MLVPESWAIFIRKNIGIDQIPPIDLWIVPDLKVIEILSTLPVLLLLSDHAVDDSTLLMQIEDRSSPTRNTDNLLIADLINLHFADFASTKPLGYAPGRFKALLFTLCFFFVEVDFCKAWADDSATFVVSDQLVCCDAPSFSEIAHIPRGESFQKQFNDWIAGCTFTRSRFCLFTLLGAKEPTC